LENWRFDSRQGPHTEGKAVGTDGFRAAVANLDVLEHTARGRLASASPEAPLLEKHEPAIASLTKEQSRVPAQPKRNFKAARETVKTVKLNYQASSASSWINLVIRTIGEIIKSLGIEGISSSLLHQRPTIKFWARLAEPVAEALINLSVKTISVSVFVHKRARLFRRAGRCALLSSG
jgi:hypothetical protein